MTVLNLQCVFTHNLVCLPQKAGLPGTGGWATVPVLSIQEAGLLYLYGIASYRRLDFLEFLAPETGLPSLGGWTAWNS